VNAAPLLLAGVVLVTLGVGALPALAVGGAIEAHLGRSAAAGRMAAAADYDWWQEFSAQATGLGTTFTPSIMGFAAVLENAGALLDNLTPGPVLGVIAAWLVVWSFVSGGILDRYARGWPTRAAGFFAACGSCFWRFLRLGVLAAGAYALLFGLVHGWIFEAYDRATREVTAERTAFAVRLAAYLVFAAVLAACATLFDYARVRIVVEDRRSAAGALVASGRFIARHPALVSALFVLNAGSVLALMAVYGLAAPAAPRSGLQMVAALFIGQAYIVGRHYVKLLAYASQTAAFQGLLAHARYTAAPVFVWPESPSVETIINAEPRSGR
jgi:hypothetical protein